MPARVVASSERSSARSSSGARRSSVLELEHDAGQRLPDLVVQLARHPAPLLLLGVERAAAAVAALALEPVEHVVERVAQLGHLGRLAFDHDPPSGRERVHAAHQRGQLLERAEHAPQREQVDGEHERDTDPQHRHLAALDPRADGRGRQREHRDGGDQDSGVDGEHAPEERHGLMMASRP